MDTSLIQQLYALLFVAGGEGVTLQVLQDTLDLPIDQVEAGLESLAHKLSLDTENPLEVTQYGEAYVLVTKQEMEPLLEHFAQSPLQQKLSRPAIETLAIIAYRQPITRMSVDEIRGVSSAAMIQKLQLRDLVKEVGRVDGPGRPVLYGVTEYFLNYFGLSSLKDLPPIESLALNSQTVTEDLFDMKRWQIDLFDQESTLAE